MYLDLLSRTLTRQIVGRPVERHTLQARVPVKRHLIALTHKVLDWFGLELVRKVEVTNEDYIESGNAARNRAEDAETMLGIKQLEQMRVAIRTVIDENIPGDLVECGVWRGGMTIFMAGALKAFDSPRNVYVADTFSGLPDQIDKTAPWFRPGDMASSLEEVKDNFRRYGLLDERVHFLKGLFSATLPGPIEKLSVLRIDADLYASTCDALNALYPKLSRGGYCVIDDYTNLADCRRAVDEYREKHGITAPIVKIDRRAVYWRAV